jgi:hypothetical protein
MNPAIFSLIFYGGMLALLGAGLLCWGGAGELLDWRRRRRGGK